MYGRVMLVLLQSSAMYCISGRRSEQRVARGADARAARREPAQVLQQVDEVRGRAVDRLAVLALEVVERAEQRLQVGQVRERARVRRRRSRRPPG